MSKIFPPQPSASENAHIPSMEKYEEIYQSSIADPEKFWAETALRIDWIKPWEMVRNFDFVNGNIRWFDGGKLNVSANCLDRHVENGHGDQTAIIWEGNDPNQSRHYSYNDVLKEVGTFANALKSLGVEKGDRICLYMQMIPELAFAMLACARIGAVHSVVFGAFSSDSLRDRINDSECKILITQDTGVRGKKQNIPMKVNADNAVALALTLQRLRDSNGDGVVDNENIEVLDAFEIFKSF